jgi:hypothetical protein
MMNQREAKSSIKALYIHAAAIAGLEVSFRSPEFLIELITPRLSEVESSRRPEATANLLRLIAACLESAQKREDKTLHEEDARNGHDKVCPIYPFGKRHGL